MCSPSPPQQFIALQIFASKFPHDLKFAKNNWLDCWTYKREFHRICNIKLAVREIWAQIKVARCNNQAVPSVKRYTCGQKLYYSGEYSYFHSRFDKLLVWKLKITRKSFENISNSYRRYKWRSCQRINFNLHTLVCKMVRFGGIRNSA